MSLPDNPLLEPLSLEIIRLDKVTQEQREAIRRLESEVATFQGRCSALEEHLRVAQERVSELLSRDWGRP